MKVNGLLLQRHAGCPGPVPEVGRGAPTPEGPARTVAALLADLLRANFRREGPFPIDLIV